ncbi:hypothetical protein DRQ00_02895 [candidate division KSB1 bacterium]|nr:MAG: hypothetical protein DRQ00_02895 [candidate division KSB1 bacterium]
MKKGKLLIHWLGQGGFAFTTSSGKVIMVDPFLSFSARKDNMTYIHSTFPISPEKAKVDYIFLTHDHSDHTDEETLLPLLKANPKARVFGPPESCSHLKKIGISEERIFEVNLEHPLHIDGIKVISVYAECTDDNWITHYGYFFDFDPIKVYITGDTKKGLHKYVDKLKWVIEQKLDILIVCINEGFNNLGPEDAAKLTALINPRIVIPMHYDCFVENTIDPQKFIDQLKPSLRSRVVLLEYGAKYLYKLGK